MTTRPSSSARNEARVQAVVSELMSTMSSRLLVESQNISGVLAREISELSSDPRLLELLNASIESNVDTVIQVLKHGIPPESLDTPAAAMEYARRAAQHAIPVTALVRAYRLGQSVFADRVYDDIAASSIEPALALRVFQQVQSLGSAYIDWISEQIVDAYQAEHERWLSNRNNIRATRILEILTPSTPINDTETSATIGYNLAQTHCALIAWLPNTHHPDAIHQLERDLRSIATQLGAVGDPLFVAVDQTTAWLWIPLGNRPDDLDLGPAHHYLRTETRLNPHLALGSRQHGSAGFRTSHLHARQTQTMMTRLHTDTTPALVSYTDPGLAAASLLTADTARVRDWIRHVLGPLADDTEHAARLRATVQVFLANQSSHKAAARQLHVHYNTIKYRIKTAENERGKPFTNDRLDVEIALLAQQWLPSTEPPRSATPGTG